MFSHRFRRSTYVATNFKRSIACVLISIPKKRSNCIDWITEITNPHHTSNFSAARFYCMIYHIDKEEGAKI